MGLKVGGSCVGRAYRVAASEAPSVLDYLTWRELRRDTYRATGCRLRIQDKVVDGICFTVNRHSVQYSGNLSLADMTTLVDEGVGSSGSSYDYLADAVAQLDAMGLRDPRLRRLFKMVQSRRDSDRSAGL